MRHASLFSGIGGPEVAAEMLGWENVFHCEINPFGRQVLEYWFPNSESYEDITKTDFTQYRGQIDVLTGGFPCQPFSYAGKRGGEKTSVISGRRCSASLTKSGQLGSLVRMLLESPLWSSPARSLTWDVRPLCSKRVTTFKNTEPSLPSQSSEYAKTLKTWDIPSSRCLFQLRPSEHRTAGTESSSLPMLQTPTAVMTCESPENMRARAARNGYQNGTKYGSLESQVMYDPRLKSMLLTPSASDGIRGNFTLRALWSHDKKNAEKSNLAEQNAHIMKDWIEDGGEDFRLSPLFTEEMMGFPLMWTTWPFLLESGEQSQSKPTETR